MNAIALSDLPVFKRIQELKTKIDELRPLDKETEARIFQKFRLDWNFHSNAIEGNTLDYGETVAFLMHGVTAKGKPFKDYIDLKGHDTAIDYVNSLIKDEYVISEKEIRALHEVILQEPYEVDTISPSGLPSKKLIQLGRYKTSPNHVKTATGEIHYYATPEETPAKMQELVEWYNDANTNLLIHPVVLAALFHHKFVSIHPFDDGNGRLARLLMNLIIMKNGYPPIIIKQEKSSRANYYMTLSQADVSDYEPFVELISEQLINSLEVYLRGALGENIEEPDDLEKEIELFKKVLDNREDKIEKRKSPEVINDFFKSSLKPLIVNLIDVTNKFSTLFFENKIKTTFKDPTTNKIDYKIFSLNDEVVKQRLRKQIDWLDFIQEKDATISILSFQLNRFKTESNLFGIELYLLIYLDEFRYQVSYTICNIDQFYEVKYESSAFYWNLKNLFENYYHTPISYEETEKISTKIGKELLENIKGLTNDPNFRKIKLSVDDLKIAWERIDLIIPEVQNDSNLLKNITFSSTNDIIVLSVKSASDENLLKKYKEEILLYFQKRFRINFPYSINIEYTP